jgi:oligopeptide/dipeptide ABC transporter ATP-binding protein
VTPLVDVRGLSIEFATARGAVHALNRVSLSVAKGRIVGIVGESGSGKSTLALSLSRLLPANARIAAGDIVFDGVALGAQPEPVLASLRGARIATVFQDPMTALNPLFTIGTHLGDVLRRRRPALAAGEVRARTVAMLTRVGIPDAARRLRQYPHEFSGGMRQRILIAMALLAEPDLLVADEPTTALDVTIERQIVDLFRTLKNDFAGSIVFVSHSLGTVAELCDEVVVMYAGTVVEQGPVARVFGRPRHPYTRALIRCETEEPGAGRRLQSIPGEVPDLVTPPPGCPFAPRCADVKPECRRAPPPWRPQPDGGAAACVLA